MNYPRAIAGVFAGCGSLLLIYQGYITEGVGILSAMLGFFIGEANGERKTVSAIEKRLALLEESGSGT